MSLSLRVRFFGEFEAAAGVGDIAFVHEGELRVDSLWDALCDKFPALNPIPGVRLVAVNEDYAGEDAPLGEGDTVAFFPPVSGG